MLDQPSSSSALPRKVFTYWHQGVANAPAVVQTCVARVQRLNPDWQVHILDKDSVDEFVMALQLPSSKLEMLNLPHRSDLIRTKLLIDHGGVWIDPTVFVTRPFDDWLPEKMEAGLFLFSRPARDRLISNWFIAAEPHHPILSALYRSLCEYWENNSFRHYNRHAVDWERMLKRLINRNLDLPRLWLTWPFRKIVRVAPYMIYHYLFYDLLCKRPELREIYSMMPFSSATRPCALQWRGLESPFDTVARELFYDEDLPLHKLSWRLKSDVVKSESVLSHLLEST